MKPSTLLRPQTAIKKINRKPNEINGLAGHPYASARSPTVTFDNENKSTPFTGDLSFQAAGSYLVASFRNVSEPGLLERALEENRVGARVLARPGRREQLLLVGYAGAPREELFAAIGVLDALLTRSCRRVT